MACATNDRKELKNTSLSKRYFVKLISNVATIPLFFLQEILLPRALGPIVYGNVNFALTFFSQITSFLDMGTSTCLRTSLAKRPYEIGLYAFYVRLILLILSLCFCIVLLLYIPQVEHIFLPDVSIWLIMPVAGYAFFTWLANVNRGVSDAMGITSGSELIRISVNISAFLFLLALYFGGILTLFSYLVLQLTTSILLNIGFFLIVFYEWKKRELSGFTSVNNSSGVKQAQLPLALLQLPKDQSKVYFREFYTYCSPLFIIMSFSVLGLVGERWILQYFSGSTAQGYFSLSQKIGMACFLFITAMMPLLMRELSVAHSNADTATMVRLMDRIAPLLYSIAAWFSCFTAIEGNSVVSLFGGKEFSGALLTVQVMAFYPIHQTYGQLASSVYYAIGETKALRNITLVGILLGMICSWVFLAPHDMGGLGLGSMGLAIKMVFIQMITVNVMLYLCTKTIPFNFFRNLFHQIFSPTVFCLLAFFSRELSTAVDIVDSSHGVFRFFASGFLYSLFSFLMVFFIPFLIGVERRELYSQTMRGYRWLKERFYKV